MSTRTLHFITNPIRNDFVGMFVDIDRVTKYYEAINSVTNETFTSWQNCFGCVSSLCLVFCTTIDNKVVYTCFCV